MSVAGGSDLIGEWHPSLKIPALLILIFTMACMRDAFPVLILLPLSLFMLTLSGLSVIDLLRHLKTPLFLVTAIAIFISFFAGEDVLIKLGPLTVMREGAIAGMGILLRVASIMTVGFVIIRTTTLSEFSSSLRRLHAPDMLVDMIILTAGYITVIGEDYERMTTATRLRGYRHGSSPKRFLEVMVPVTATLLIRSFKRSERVFNAMKARGYGKNNVNISIAGSPKLSDILLLALTVLVSASLITLELFA